MRTTRATTAVHDRTLAQKPDAIRVLSERAPVTKDGKLATAQIGFIAAGDAAQLQSEAKRVGMKAIGNNQHVHSDGSWVMMNDNGSVDRGARSVRFQGVPVAYVAPPPALPAADKRKLNAMLKQTPAIPESMSEYAIAKVGIVDADTIATAAIAAGFAQIGSRWVHPDGSWLLNDRGLISVGWKGHDLRVLPYYGAW